MGKGLLPFGQAWVGFDGSGICVAVSIEQRKPSTKRGDVMEGCADVVLCRMKDGQSIFGLHKKDCEVLE